MSSTYDQIASIIVGKRKLLRGHYNPTSTSRKYPNLQWAKVDGVRMRICTQCMKKVHKPEHKKNKSKAD